MKKAFAMKWAKALRSGKYKQTKNVLFDGEGYCCLGVACIVAGAKFEKRKDNDSQHYGGQYYYVVNDDDSEDDKVLPDKIMKKMGMKTPEGTYNTNKSLALTGLNDDGKSFNKIADFIEKYYEKL
jgi:hypothetical protein